MNSKRWFSTKTQALVALVLILIGVLANASSEIEGESMSEMEFLNSLDTEDDNAEDIVQSIEQTVGGGKPSALKFKYARLLDDSNFEHQTQASTGATTGDWFVLLYADGCPHSRKLLPVMEELAFVLRGQMSVAVVDISVNVGIKQRFSVQEYPLLLFFHHGKYVTYTGERNIRGLLQFAKAPFDYKRALVVPEEVSVMIQKQQEMGILLSDMKAMNSIHLILSVAGFVTVLFLTMMCSKADDPTGDFGDEEETDEAEVAKPETAVKHCDVVEGVIGKPEAEPKVTRRRVSVGTENSKSNEDQGKKGPQSKKDSKKTK
eukprot:Nk52_evm4s1360 gene=Nk52_evmTU4s1360